MLTRSGDDDAGALRHDGFLVLRSVIPAAEAARLAAMAAEIADACDVEVCRRPNTELVPLRWNAPALSTVLGNADRMRRVHRACGGADLRWLTAYLSIKEPQSGPLPWHQDWWCWDHPISFAVDAPQIALLCYLDPADAFRGALRLLPGSHRSVGRLHEVVSAADPDPHPQSAVMRNQPGQVSVNVEPGDAVLIDYRLLHGTHENASDSMRSCLVLNFAPSWRTLPPEIRSHLIQSWALPGDADLPLVEPAQRRWLPRFEGPRRDLHPNRVPRIRSQSPASVAHP